MYFRIECGWNIAFHFMVLFTNLKQFLIVRKYLIDIYKTLKNAQNDTIIWFDKWLLKIDISKSYIIFLIRVNVYFSYPGFEKSPSECVSFDDCILPFITDSCHSCLYNTSYACLFYNGIFNGIHGTFSKILYSFFFIVFIFESVEKKMFKYFFR